MKLTHYLLGLFLLLTTFAFVACDNEEDDIKSPPKTVESAFAEKYPNAQFVDWEREYGLYKAEFRNDAAISEAWFEADGSWVKTETNVLPNTLSQPVLDYVALNYQGYRIDDADWVETPERNYYELELEKGDKLEFHLLILPDGTPLN